MPNSASATKKDRVLVVDDDERIRDLLRRYLTQEGFDVVVAEDGKALTRLMTLIQTRRALQRMITGGLRELLGGPPAPPARSFSANVPCGVNSSSNSPARY